MPNPDSSLLENVGRRCLLFLPNDLLAFLDSAIEVFLDSLHCPTFDPQQTQPIMDKPRDWGLEARVGSRTHE